MKDFNNENLIKNNPSDSIPPMQNGLFSVKPEEWEKAKAFFAQNENAVKYNKDRKNTDSRSFIKVNDIIYALQTGGYADGKKVKGEGAFGKVKIVQNEQGDNYAVKIEGRGKRGEQDAELDIMGRLGMFLGEAERKDNQGKIFKNVFTDQRLYTIMALKAGDELVSALYRSGNREWGHKDRSELTDSKRLLLAIKCAEAIKVIHDKNILHCDIKPENFMANENGDTMIVGVIDFGLSLLMPDNDKRGRVEGIIARGTPIYVAPEIANVDERDFQFLPKNFPVYSKASDIYALGKMFEHDFHLTMSGDFYNRILNKDPNMRPNMQTLIDELYFELSNQPFLSDEEKKAIDSYIDKRKNEIPHQIKSIKNIDELVIATKILINTPDQNKILDEIRQTVRKGEEIPDSINNITTENGIKEKLKGILTHEKNEARQKKEQEKHIAKIIESDVKNTKTVDDLFDIAEKLENPILKKRIGQIINNAYYCYNYNDFSHNQWLNDVPQNYGIRNKLAELTNLTKNQSEQDLRNAILNSNHPTDFYNLISLLQDNVLLMNVKAVLDDAIYYGTINEVALHRIDKRFGIQDQLRSIMLGEVSKKNLSIAIEAAQNHSELFGIIRSLNDSELTKNMAHVLDDAINRGIINNDSLNKIDNHYGMHDKLRSIMLGEVSKKNMPAAIEATQNKNEFLSLIKKRGDINLEYNVEQLMLDASRFRRIDEQFLNSITKENGIQEKAALFAKAILSEKQINHHIKDEIDHALPRLLSQISESLRQLPQEKSKHSSSASLERWMFDKHKNTEKFIFEKEKNQETPIKLLSESIEWINNNSKGPRRSPEEKTKYLYAILTKIENDIKAEHNTRKSGLKEMIQKQRKSLENEFPNVKQIDAKTIQDMAEHILQDVHSPNKNNVKKNQRKI